MAKEGVLEDKDRPRGLLDFIPALEKRSQIDKDYYKFTVGLATGCLVFSVTFYRELGTLTHYHFLLALGWFFLLFSVLTGVYLFPFIDRLKIHLHTLGDFLGKDQDQQLVFVFGKFESNGLTLLSESSGKSNRKRINKDRLKELIKKLDIKNDDLHILEEVMEDLSKESDKLASLFRFVVGGKTYPGRLCRNVRRGMWILLFLPKAHQFSFLLGISLIGVFGIINVWKWTGSWS